MRKNKRYKFISVILIVILVLALVVPLIAHVTGAEPLDETESTGDVLQATELTESASEDAPEDTESEEVTSESEEDYLPDGNVCAKGVYIDNMDVGGMTRAELSGAIDRKIAEYEDDVVDLYAGAQHATLRVGDLDLVCTNREEVLEDALIARNKGNVVRRFQAEQYLEQNGQIVFELDFSVDEKAARVAITEQQDRLNADPIPVSMELTKDGDLLTKEKVDGIRVQVVDSAEKLTDYIERDWHGGRGAITLDGKVLPAGGDAADLVEVKDLLGRSETDYSDSDDGRAANIELAASRVSGTIVYPGEEFNFRDAVGETTAENGFALAGSYENGEVVETYGGGICQVSTTLYLAVIRAELEVTERHPHSMTVKYVKPSFDAAIADDVKNFRFVNNQETPIFIHANAENGSIAFSIYGKETRDKARSIEFESRQVGTEEHGTEYVLDSSIPVGQIESSGGRDGLDAQLWKIITYEGSSETEEEQVNSSSYNVIPLTYRVGTAGAGDAWLQEIDRAVSSKNLDEIQSVISW